MIVRRRLFLYRPRRQHTTDPTRCSEQSRRKTVTQSYGTTATEIATSAEPPAQSSAPAAFLIELPPAATDKQTRHAGARTAVNRGRRTATGESRAKSRYPQR